MKRLRQRMISGRMNTENALTEVSTEPYGVSFMRERLNPLDCVSLAKVSDLAQLRDRRSAVSITRVRRTWQSRTHVTRRYSPRRALGPRP